MSNYDHYQEAKSIITMLQESSLANYSDLLQNAMDEGATGTEIFMALRWNLENLLKEDDLDDLIKARITRLKEELDKALQPA